MNGYFVSRETIAISVKVVGCWLKITRISNLPWSLHEEAISTIARKILKPLKGFF